MHNKDIVFHLFFFGSIASLQSLTSSYLFGLNYFTDGIFVIGFSLVCLGWLRAAVFHGKKYKKLEFTVKWEQSRESDINWSLRNGCLLFFFSFLLLGLDFKIGSLVKHGYLPLIVILIMMLFSLLCLGSNWDAFLGEKVTNQGSDEGE